MKLKTRDLGPKPKTLVCLTILTLAIFNNWLLGPVLNPVLFKNNGSVSEFGALTQPHWQVFRDLDILSGGLLVLLGILFLGFIKRSTWSGKVLVYGTIGLGLANAFDGRFSLPCSETLSRSCVVPVSLSLSRLQLPSHAYSSVAIAIGYLLLPLAGLGYAKAIKSRLLTNLSWLAVVMALWSLASASWQYLSEQSFSVKTSGAGQEVQMLVLGVWFIGLSLSVYKLGERRTTRRTRQTVLRIVKIRDFRPD